MIKIKNFYPHSVTGKQNDSFIGLRIKGNDIHFHYPESYRFDESSNSVRKDIIDLLRTISIAHTFTPEESGANNIRDKEAEFALMSYLWVIKDFLVNGFYKNREKNYKINQSGRIDWKRTMKFQPIISNGNVIYKDITVEVKSHVDNIIVDIHRYCVKVSIDYIGWLFNLSSNFIQTKPFNKSVKKEYETVLAKEITQTYDDDKRLRLTHCLNVIKGLDINISNKEFVYGVDKYHYVFEKMIDSIFSNVKDLNDFRPSSSWHLVRDNFMSKKSSNLHPDTVLIKDSNIFVLDSKFYRFGYTGNAQDLPDTTSIQKQITYGDYIKKNLQKEKINNVYNAFLLPYDKRREVFLSEDNIQYVGFAKSTWKDNNKKHEIVHTFLIDLYHVVKTWNMYNHKDDVDFLVNAIIEHQQEVTEIL